jgi:hypothetical protein
MNGKYVKLLGPFVGKDGKTYSKLYFEDKNDRVFYSYAVESNRNYKRWKRVIDSGVGSEVSGLEIYRGAVIDADSPVMVRG